MFFKLRITVPDVWFTTPEPININKVGKDKNVRVSLRQSEKEEAENSFFIMCEAIADIKLSNKASLVVNALWEDKLPDEYDLSSLSDGLRESYVRTGRIKPYEFPKSSLPSSVQNLLDEVYKILVKSTQQILGIASWKFAQNAPIHTFRYGPMMWSNDGKEWRMTPRNIVVDMSLRPIQFWKDNETEIQTMLDENRNEPLSQELFREAWHQRGLNIRSALVIGITALETGVKDLIADLIPESEWLIKNVPSPPVHKILKEYFPKLPVKAKLKSKILCPSEDMIKEVHKWNNQRNEIVHGKKIDLDYDKLKEFLLLVRDLLYLCDYSRGEEWALENIRDVTRNKLQLSKNSE